MKKNADTADPQAEPQIFADFRIINPCSSAIFFSNPWKSAFKKVKYK
jgi:hypothetical protein